MKITCTESESRDLVPNRVLMCDRRLIEIINIIIIIIISDGNGDDVGTMHTHNLHGESSAQRCKRQVLDASYLLKNSWKRHNLCEPIRLIPRERAREIGNSSSRRTVVAADAELQQQNAVFAWRERARARGRVRLRKLYHLQFTAPVDRRWWRRFDAIRLIFFVFVFVFFFACENMHRARCGVRDSDIPQRSAFTICNAIYTHGNWKIRN